MAGIEMPGEFAGEVLVLQNEISDTLDLMIEKIKHRKDFLIKEIEETHTDFLRSRRDKRKSLKELELLKEQILIEQNSNNAVQNEIFASIDAQINTLKIELDSVFDLEFVHPSANDFEKYIIQVFTVGKKDKFVIPPKADRVLGESILNGPMKLGFDKETKQIYTPDARNRRIQVFTSRGEPSSTFGFGPLNFPCSVDLDDTYCYVADSAGGAIHQFSKRDFKLTRSQKDTIGSEHRSLSMPVDIKVNSQKLYVSDLDNNRVCIFTDLLAYTGRFGQEVLHKPQYVQFHNNRIYVLDGGRRFFLHVFDHHLNPEHQFEKIGVNYSIVNPKSFCFSPNFDKLIVADFDANCIKVLQITENRLLLKFKLGKDVPGGEVIDGCMGVIMVGNQIVVSCQKPSCLKVF